jgi:hypothetical protein
MKKRHGLFALLLLLTATLACVLPGRSPASVPQSTPDTRLGTMVAETVSAAFELTRQAAPTETPPPTSIPEPTATPAREASGAGSTLTVQDNSSTLFTDENAGYRIAIPAGWLAVRVNEKEYFDAFLLPQAADKHIQAALQSIQNQDPKTFRLLVVDIMDGHIQNEIVTNVNFTWDPQKTFSLDDDEDLETLADELPSMVDGLTVKSTGFVILPSGVIHGEVQSEIGGYNALGEEVLLYQKMAVFNVKTGMLIVTFTTDAWFSETTLPMFNGMLETLFIDME